MNKDSTYCHPIFFPTKVAIIDADPDYLAQVSLLVDYHLACDLFTSSSQALKAMRRCEKESHRFTEKCSQQLSVCLDMNGDLGVNANQLHKFAYDEQRFDRFSVMVINYAMPEMNGLDLCEQVRDPYIKKILITAKADSEVAIEAFNEGLIDQCIRKEDIKTRLNTVITKLSHQYFTEICAAQHNDVLSQEAPYLFDETFIAWFDGLCKTHNIVEYYLWGKWTIQGFLLADDAGDFKVLLVQTPETAASQCEIALDNAKVPKVPCELFEGIRTSKVIPYFPADDIYEASNRNKWQQYVYPAQPVGHYYYALVGADDLPESEVAPIGCSYKRFLKAFHSGEAVLNKPNQNIVPLISE